MIHYTCDMCAKRINSEAEPRFRVLIDIEQMRPGEDDSDLEEEDDNDFDCKPNSGQENDEGIYRSFKFDLCRECAAAYLRNPLARSYIYSEMPRRLRFLDN